MAVPLEAKFMAQLDMYSSQLIRIIRAKGGATRQKTADIMDALDKVNLYHDEVLEFSPIIKRCHNSSASFYRYISICRP